MQKSVQKLSKAKIYFLVFKQCIIGRLEDGACKNGICMET